MAIIKTEDLTYVYSAGTPFEKKAIDNLNIEIEEGELVGIIGHTGSGKSTLLKKLMVHAQMKGLDVEVYHCGFDPNSLDMILLPELDTVIFDSTAPHEYFPSRENDVVVDMYKELITEGTDETYAEEFIQDNPTLKDDELSTDDNNNEDNNLAN